MKIAILVFGITQFIAAFIEKYHGDEIYKVTLLTATICYCTHSLLEAIDKNK